MKFKRAKETSTYTFGTTSKYQNQRSGDCVVRAISLATGKEWQEVFDGLCEISRPLYRMPNDKVVYAKYLERIGWRRCKQPRKDDNTKYTGKEFCKMVDVAVANIGGHHVTCVKGGKIHDIWDCTDGCIGVYWVKDKD